MKKFNAISKDNIKILVDKFYKKVGDNDDLAPVFEGAIGITDKEREPHLEKTYTIWI